MNHWTRTVWGPLETWGSAEPEMLLVSGCGGRAAGFRAVVESLSIPAAAVELPGHGDNPGPLLTTIEQMAEAVESAVAELAALGRPVVLLGHSMGGGIAIEVALRRRVAPGSVRALILYSTGARLRVSPVVFAAIEGERGPRTRDSVRPFFGPSTTDAALDDYLALPQHPTNEQALTDFRATDRFDRLTEVATITVPTLVLGGDSDPPTPLKHQAYLAEKIPGAARVILPGAGHMAHIEQRAAFVAAVEAFLATLP